jgi:hypothetical protein
MGQIQYKNHDRQKWLEHRDHYSHRQPMLMSIVMVEWEINIWGVTVLAPEENKVVIYRNFFKAGIRFPLSRFVVEVLKTYQIFLHQLTLEAILRMGIFVWAVRSQGIEPSAKCFCSMDELLYETKAMGKEQYHNNLDELLLWICRPRQRQPPSANISEEMAQNLDGVGGLLRRRRSCEK